jgi:hypothetical protein
MMFAALFVLPFVFSCSDDDNPSGPEETPPPEINVASVNVTCGNSQDCIQFFARPDKDVVLVKVVITNPAGDEVTFNLESSTVIDGENIALQADDFAYFRVSGEWEFVFTGNLATGDKSSFEVTTTVNVSA